MWSSDTPRQTRPDDNACLHLGDHGGGRESTASRTRRGRRLGALATVAGLMLAACSDAASPTAPGMGTPTTPVSALLTGDSTAYHRTLLLAADAPALEATSASFYAVRGTNRSIEIRYTNGKNGGSGDRYVRFTVPDGALVTDVAGNKLRRGDSVLVTVKLNQTYFRVDFEPSGLSFARNVPARLEVWYQYADPDVNRDGLVDAADQIIFNEQLAVFHYDSPSSKQWVKVSSSNDRISKTISAPIDGFSGYAIAW